MTQTVQEGPVGGVALVTGAARGLGLAIATLLAERGRAVILVDRDPSVVEAANALTERGFDASAQTGDLTDEADVARIRDAVAGEQRGISVLVNNAGITRDARLLKMDVPGFEAVLDVNLIAPMRFTFALEELLTDGASVVNMSSRAALGNFGQTNYVASKSGLVGFTRALALSWAPRVRVNAVAPGLIESAMTGAMPEEVLAGLVAKVPVARIGTPDDVARAVAFLASDESAYITGQVLTVCGGRSIAP